MLAFTTGSTLRRGRGSGARQLGSQARLIAGSHGVLLAGLASNCATQGEANPRTVNVVAGVTARVAFSVTCVATRGRILFASDRSGTPQIHTMNSDGTGVTQLTSDTVGA